MITTDHMYAPLLSEQTIYTSSCPFPETQAPDWMLLLTTHLHCHESEEPKCASNPELSHYSLYSLYPTLGCQDPEITVTIALSNKEERTPVCTTNFFQPWLFRRSKTIQYRRVQALLETWGSSFVRSQNASKQATALWEVALCSLLLDAVLCVPVLDGVVPLQLPEPLKKLLERRPLLRVAAHSKGNR